MAEQSSVSVEQLKEDIAQAVSTAVNRFSSDEDTLGQELMKRAWHVTSTTRQGEPIRAVRISPPAAFSIVEAESGWDVKITSPAALYEIDHDTNTLRPVDVHVDYDLGGTARKGILFENTSSCVNTLSYFQLGGRRVNLEGLFREGGNYASEFKFDRSLLRQDRIFGNQVVFTRLRPGDADVALVVKYKPTSEEQTITHVIPECGIPPNHLWPSVQLAGGSLARVSLGVVHRSGVLGIRYAVDGEKWLANTSIGARTSQPYVVGFTLSAGYVGDVFTSLIGAPVRLRLDSDYRIGLGAEVQLGVRVMDNVDLIGISGGVAFDASPIEYYAVGGIAITSGRPTSSKYEIPTAPDLVTASAPLPSTEGSGAGRTQESTVAEPVPAELTVEAAMPEFKNVQERAAACSASTGHSGNVVLVVSIEPSGDVADVSITSSPDDSLSTCVTNVVKQSSFPKSVKGAKFNVPINVGNAADAM